MLCLTTDTDDAWLEHARADLDAVFLDHAHCELKAASHALSLVMRHTPQAPIADALIKLVNEETAHFRQVMALLERRGLSLGPPVVDAYARGLRKLAAENPCRLPLLADRLVVASIIEARSCERFRLLADMFERDGLTDLHDFYGTLLAAEARHYRIYVDLAASVEGATADLVERRLAALCEGEGALVRELSAAECRASVHG